MNNIFPIFVTLFFVVLMLYLSYFVTKFIGGKAVRSSRSKYMQVLDTLIVTQDKTMIIAGINNKCYLFSVTPSDIKLIKELEDLKVSDFDTGSKDEIYNMSDFKNLIISKMPTGKKD